MEFEKIYLEKSWNFVTDLKLCESNFSCASRTFQVTIVHAFVQFIAVHWLFPKFFLSCDQSVYVHGLTWCFRRLFLFIFIWYLYPGKTEIFLEKSWKNHGIRFRNSAGNPAERSVTKFVTHYGPTVRGRNMKFSGDVALRMTIHQNSKKFGSVAMETWKCGIADF